MQALVPRLTPADMDPVRAQIEDLLRTARESLGLPMAYLTHLDATTQQLQVVDPTEAGAVGATGDRSASLCHAILAGRLPRVIPDTRSMPAAAALPPVADGSINSYVSVPVRLRDGRLYGTFCAASSTAHPDLTDTDARLMEVLAHVAATLIESQVDANERRHAVVEQVQQVLHGGGPEIVWQPIVDMTTGSCQGFEALSRFPSHWQARPDRCFAAARSVGFGLDLELAAVQRARADLATVPGFVAVNLSPDVLVTRRATDLLATLPLHRLVVELSEQHPVTDYPTLELAVGPLRASGMRLAIDDVGAGFSSLRHILMTRPDIVKLDRALIDGIDTDPIKAALVESLVQFSAAADAHTVAEGIETPGEAYRLVELGVSSGQGWLYGRPGPARQSMGTTSQASPIAPPAVAS